MTFHGEPRASHEVMHHVHESPPVMLVPLFILAAGALFAGVIFHEHFIGEGYAEFWKARAVHAAGQPHPRRDAPRAAAGCELSPFVAMVIGFAGRLAVLHPLAARCRRSSPRSNRGLYAFLLNKWYFDELYDFLFVRPAKRLGTLPVEDRATAGSSTASARTASRRASSTSPTASCSCSPAISTTTPSPC